MKFVFKLEAVKNHRRLLKELANREYQAAKFVVDQKLAQIKLMYAAIDSARERAELHQKQPNATATLANYGNMPAGTSSYTMVTTSNGSKSCTRSVEVTSQGAGKPPKVVSNSSGDCPAQKGAPAAAVPTA